MIPPRTMTRHFVVAEIIAPAIHFFAAAFLVLFVLVHIAMVCLAGFRNRVGAMITGHSTARKEHR